VSIPEQESEYRLRHLGEGQGRRYVLQKKPGLTLELSEPSTLHNPYLHVLQFHLIMDGEPDTQRYVLEVIFAIAVHHYPQKSNL
jgi:hypothetical protein